MPEVMNSYFLKNYLFAIFFILFSVESLVIVIGLF